MDISEIKINQLDPQLGIRIGQAAAPVTIIEYINVRCPFCRQWFDEKEALLTEYVAAGKIKRVIKLFDKSKPGLDKGNVMHQFLPKKENQQVLSALAAIYETQDEWGELEEMTAIAEFAHRRLKLELAPDTASANAIVAEAAAAKIQFVPTMVVGEHIFDQKISREDLKKILDN